MTTRPAQVGDFIRIDAHVPRLHPRLGQILEIFGGGRERYRVRWDDDSESMLFPSRPVEIVASFAAYGGSEAAGLHPPEIYAPEPIRIESTATLRQIAENMTAADRAAVIVHDLDRVTGIITEHDVTRALATGADPDELLAADILLDEEPATEESAESR